MVFATRVADAGECSRDAVRNAAFSDADIAAALASFAADAHVAADCSVTCIEERMWVPGEDNATAIANTHRTATGHLHLEYNGTHEDVSALLVALDAFSDVATPHLRAAQYATLTVANASELAEAIDALAFAPAAQLLSSPHGMQAGVAGLAYPEKAALCASVDFATGCTPHAVLGATPSGACVDFDSNESAWHTDTIVSKVRHAHAEVVPLKVQDEVVRVRLVIPDGALDGDLGIVAALRPLVHIERQRAKRWRRETLRVEWSDSTRAPNASDAVAVLGDEMPRPALVHILEHTVRATVLLRNAPGSSTSAEMLDLGRGTLEVSLQDMLAADFVQLGSFEALAQDSYDFRVALVAGAASRGCAALGYAVLDALLDIEAWSMGMFAAASTAEGQVACALDVVAESIEPVVAQVWKHRALFAGANVSSLVLDLGAREVEMVSLNTSSLVAMDRAADIVLKAAGPGEALTLALLTSHVQHSLGVCGLLNSSLVADALGSAYGMHPIPKHFNPDLIFFFCGRSLHTSTSGFGIQ